MKGLRRSLFLVLVLLLAISLVPACTGQQADDGSSQGPEQEDPVTFVFGRGADADRLDPARTTNGESVKVITNVFNGLVKFKPGSTEVEADLATDWAVSDDGLEYTFTLREDVKFHDGTPFNADAVMFTFERQMDDTHPFHFDDMAYAGFTLEPVKEIVKTGDFEVKFVLHNEYAPFLRNLAMFSNYIVCPSAVEELGADYANEPVGTGPFTFEEWVRDNSITLKANADYFGGKPAIDTLVFRVIPENASRLAELESGTIHLMDGLSPNDIGRVEGNAQLNLISMPGLNINYMAFPTDKEPFNDVRVRQAISHAINKAEIVEFLFKGAGVVAEGPIPKTMMDYDVEGFDYNLDKAKALLAEAGYPDGFTTTIWCYPNPRAYNPIGAQLAEAVAGNLAEIGITADIQTMEWTSYLAQSKSPEYFDGPFFLGWMGDNGDVDNFLYVLLSTDNIPSGNRSRYSNTEVDELLLEAQQTTDNAQREALYREAIELIVADAPWVFVSHTNDMVAMSKKVNGFVQSPLTLFFFENVTLGD